MGLFFAQAASVAHGEYFAWGALVFWAAFVLVFVPMLVMARRSRVRNDQEHAERMRMIEMGLAVPPRDGAAWPKALVCIAIGAGVPVVAFVSTLIAYVGRSNAADELWVAPAVVSGLSVIGGAVLSALLFGKRAGLDQEASEVGIRADRGLKQVMDPDAFDVASRRG